MQMLDIAGNDLKCVMNLMFAMVLLDKWSWINGSYGWGVDVNVFLNLGEPRDMWQRDRKSAAVDVL